MRHTPLFLACTIALACTTSCASALPSTMTAPTRKVTPALAAGTLPALGRQGVSVALPLAVRPFAGRTAQGVAASVVRPLDVRDVTRVVVRIVDLANYGDAAQVSVEPFDAGSVVVFNNLKLGHVYDIASHAYGTNPLTQATDEDLTSPNADASRATLHVPQVGSTGALEQVLVPTADAYEEGAGGLLTAGNGLLLSASGAAIEGLPLLLKDQQFAGEAGLGVQVTPGGVENTGQAVTAGTSAP